VFMLRYAPVLPRRTDGALPEGLEVERPDGTFERWTEVAHFGDSGPADAHYMLDDLTGEVRFGPVLRDITGQERQHGRVPPKGRLIRFARYRSGGGSEGNVGRGTLVVPKSSANLDYVQRVTNLRPAYGGRDGETLEELMLRGPSLVRTRDVAVTRADYEDLVLDQFPQVAQVRCLPGASDPRANGSGASYVRLLLVPAAPAGDGPLVHEQLLAALDDRELCRQVRGWLAERCPLTTELAVGWADFQWVSVAARLVMRPQPDLAPFELEAVQARIREEARRRLYRFIHPSAGGPERKGWPFGRSLTLGDIYSLLEGMPDVRWVAGARLRRVSYDKTGRVLGPDVSVLDLPESAVLCSDAHEIEIVVE
jgi:predicted phage baseplate assembly protein